MRGNAEMLKEPLSIGKNRTKNQRQTFARKAAPLAAEEAQRLLERTRALIIVLCVWLERIRTFRKGGCFGAFSFRVLSFFFFEFFL